MQSVAIVASLVLVALAGCATVDEPIPVESPEPVYTAPPDPDAAVGLLHITLDVTPVGTTVPADVVFTLAIDPTNAIGQPLAGNVSWRIDVTGPDTLTIQGTGQAAEETIHLTERGTYQAIVSATAPRFHNASLTETFVVDPVPLGAAFALVNGTRGDWFILNGTASDGYSDLGYTCSWNATADVQIVNASACDSDARWLGTGNQSIALTIDDGRSNITLNQTVHVLPLSALTMPAAAPDDAQIVDDSTETQAPHLNIKKGWFASDLDTLYVGLQVEGIPHNHATRDATYRVTFTPSWNATLASGQAEQFRVSATHPINDAAGMPVTDGPRFFRLEAKVAGAWESLGDVAGAKVATDTGVFWWPVPRDVLQAPLLDAVITDLSASSSGGASDSASTDDPYALA